MSTWKERYRQGIEVLPVAADGVEDALLTGRGDVAFVRLPLVQDSLAAIPLWTEESVLLVSRENELSLLEEVMPEHLQGETLITPLDDVLRWAEAPGSAFGGLPPAGAEEGVELVAAEAGVMLVPASIARAHTRRDVVAVPATGTPTSRVALAWVPVDHEAPAAVADFIGIVRGRTANSSRGRDSQESENARPTAKAKAEAAKARAAQARGKGGKGAQGRARPGAPRQQRGGTGRRRQGR